jgi:hypothetical protein
MDGSKHDRVIRKWFESVLSEGGIDRYDDLHIDQIDRSWKAPAKWIAAALSSFRAAEQLRNKLSSPDRPSVVLAFALKAADYPIGVTFRGREELESSFSATPPSLYLFRPGREFWHEAEEYATRMGKNVLYITQLAPSSFFPDLSSDVKCIYMEFLREGDDEYTRDLFLAV